MHLILTVGTNPLPVYVAGKIFLAYFQKKKDPVKRLTLIMSEETSEYQDILKHNLCPENSNIEFGPLVVEPGNPRDIVTELTAYLKVDMNCHFNYTGGTKALAVHCWQVIRDKYLKNGAGSYGCNASYLDPRGGSNGPMIIDDQGRTLETDCRRHITLDIDKLLGLHQYATLQEPVIPDKEWPGLLFDMVKEPEGMEIYDKFYNNNWQRMSADPEGSCPALNLEWWGRFCESFTSTYLKDKNYPCLFDENGTFHRNKLGKKKLQSLTKEIDGKFLEYDLYYKIQNILEKIKADHPERNNFYLYNSVMPIRAREKQEAQQKRKKGKLDNAELDVVVILGYQLVLFSCTTGKNKGIVKLKAMEAMHRAQQIGGDEARAVVVCAAARKTADLTANDLYEDCGRKNESLIKVWGHDTWAEMETKLNDFFTRILLWS